MISTKQVCIRRRVSTKVGMDKNLLQLSHTYPSQKIIKQLPLGLLMIHANKTAASTHLYPPSFPFHALYCTVYSACKPACAMELK